MDEITVLASLVERQYGAQIHHEDTQKEISPTPRN
jgi:hypothetical protein